MTLKFSPQTRTLLFTGLVGFWLTAANADTYTPSHSCFQPHRPYSGSDEWAWRRFKTDIDTYKDCIESFVEEQNEEAQQHLEAAEEAVDEWNDFVSRELR